MNKKKLDWQRTQARCQEWGADNAPGKRYLSFFVSVFDGYFCNIEQPESENLWGLVAHTGRRPTAPVLLGIFKTKKRAMEYAENFLTDV